MLMWKWKFTVRCFKVHVWVHSCGFPELRLHAAMCGRIMYLQLVTAENGLKLPHIVFYVAMKHKYEEEIMPYI